MPSDDGSIGDDENEYYEYYDNKECFDNLDKDMKTVILFQFMIIDGCYDKFINILNNFDVEECINEIYRGRTLLECVYECQNYLIFESLLNYQKINLNITNSYNENILFTLIKADDYDFFMTCIEKMDTTKIDIKFESTKGDNLLDLALKSSNFNFLKILLTLPCSCNLCFTNEELCILLQNALSEGYIETFKIIYELLDSTYDINICLPLHCAVFGGIDTVKFVMNLNNIDFNKKNKDGHTAFRIVCRETNINNMDIMELFLKDDRIDVNLADYDNATPFYACCHFFLNDKVKMMLDYSKIRYIDLNKPRKNGTTPFHHAVTRADIGLTKLLLDFDGNMDYNSRNINGVSPFYSICWNDFIRDILNNNYYKPGKFEQHHAEIVKLLLNDDRIDKSDIDKAYQSVKDNNVEYIAEILADYLNHN